MFGIWLALGIIVMAIIYCIMAITLLKKEIDRLSDNKVNKYSLDRLIDERLKYYKLLVLDKTGWERSALNNYVTSKEFNTLIADLGYERLVEPARTEQIAFVKKSRIN